MSFTTYFFETLQFHDLICQVTTSQSFLKLRGHNCVHFVQTIVYCHLQFELRYLKNLKLFLIRVKELLEPIVLRRKGDGFLLFLKILS